MEDKKLYAKHCKRCGRDWHSQTEDPTVCGKCRSPYWDKDKLRRNTSDNLGENRRKSEEINE